MIAPDGQFLNLSLLSILLPVAVYTELAEGKIRNWLTFPGLGASLLVAAMQPAPTIPAFLWGALLGASLAFYPFVTDTALKLVLLGGAALGAGIGWWAGGEPFLQALWGAAIGGGIFLLPYLVSAAGRKQTTVGGGDVKLSAVIGSLVGITSILQVIYYAILMGLVLAVVYTVGDWLRRRRLPGSTGQAAGAKQAPLMRRRIPFGVALCASSFLVYLWPFLAGINPTGEVK